MGQVTHLFARIHLLVNIIHRLRGIIQINRIININLTPDPTALRKPSASLPLDWKNAVTYSKEEHDQFLHMHLFIFPAGRLIIRDPILDKLLQREIGLYKGVYGRLSVHRTGSGRGEGTY